MPVADHFPDSLYKPACHIVKRIREAGAQAYFAGGCVRDMLLGRDIKDIDIATSLPPQEIQALFPKTVPVGIAFGVIIVIEDGVNFEVATFRSDGDYSDGRRPDNVVFSSIEEDAQRRDFTINALFFNPIDKTIIDLIEGEKDLNAGVVRAVGDAHQRIKEDKLRMMRACRFAGGLGFKLDDQARQAIQDMASNISQVSAERIGEELTKMLLSGAAHQCFEQLENCGLLTHILPELKATQGVEQPAEFHPEGDVWKHTLLLLKKMKRPSKALAFAALLHDIGKPPTQTFEDRIRFNNHDHVGADMAEAICERLRFSNRDTETITHLVRTHMQFIPVQNMRPAKLKRFIWQDHFDDMLELHRLDCLSSFGQLDNYDFCRQKREEFAQEQEVLAPLITGKHLIDLGYHPGKQFGKILHCVQDEQLENRLNTEEDAINFVKKNFPL